MIGEKEGITDTIADRVLSARKAFRLSQEQFGRAARVTRAAVSSWESGGVKPGAESVFWLQRTLGISAEWLITGQGPMKKAPQQSQPKAKKPRPRHDKIIKMARLYCQLLPHQQQQHFAAVIESIAENDNLLRQLDGLKTELAQFDAEFTDAPDES